MEENNSEREMRRI